LSSRQTSGAVIDRPPMCRCLIDTLEKPLYHGRFASGRLTAPPNTSVRKIRKTRSCWLLGGRLPTAEERVRCM
jgi:hypothetical protein